MHERLRHLREDKDLSQTAMAKALCVAQTTYSDYELGKLNIPLAILCKLALFHDTSIDYLLELTDTQAPYPRREESL